MADTTTNMTPATLRIIRLALLAGVVLFGAVAWFLTQSGSYEASLDEATASALRLAFIAVLFSIVFGMELVRRRAYLLASFAQRAPLLLAGYAMAEAAALFGGVYLLLTGTPLLYLAGLLVFLLAFVRFPIEASGE